MVARQKARRLLLFQPVLFFGRRRFGFIIHGCVPFGVAMLRSTRVTYQSSSSSQIVLPRVELPERTRSVEIVDLVVEHQREKLVLEPVGDQLVALTRGADEMVREVLLVSTFDGRLIGQLLEFARLANVVGTHAIEDEISLVGHFDHVIFARVSQQTSFVDELDERETSVFLDERRGECARTVEREGDVPGGNSATPESTGA